MQEFHQRFSTRSFPNTVVVMMGGLGILLGAWFYSFRTDVVICVMAFSIVVFVTAGISWCRGEVSELHINEDRLLFKHGNEEVICRRTDVLLIICDSEEIDRMSVVLKDAQHIYIPPSCCRYAPPVVDFLCERWPEVAVEVNHKRVAGSSR